MEPYSQVVDIIKNYQLLKNLLNNHEPELGNNIYFAAYYVKNTGGGAAMETLCEIGVTTADLICKKYNNSNPRKPVFKTNNYLYSIFLPFIILDNILYKLKPITDYVNPIILLVMIFCYKFNKTCKY